AGGAEYPRRVPSRNEPTEQRVSGAGKTLAFAKGKIIDPVAVENVRLVKVRRAVFGIEIERVGQQVGDILYDADLIERARQRVVQIEGQVVGVTLAQGHDQGVVVGAAQRGAEEKLCGLPKV